MFISASLNDGILCFWVFDCGVFLCVLVKLTELLNIILDFDFHVKLKIKKMSSLCFSNKLLCNNILVKFVKIIELINSRVHEYELIKGFVSISCYKK